jgi:hypothetical protein
MAANRVIGVNDKGIRVGEDHQHAKLSNAEIDLLLELREEGLSYRQLAEKFEISKSHARYICKGRWRCQAATRFMALDRGARN